MSRTFDGRLTTNPYVCMSFPGLRVLSHTFAKKQKFKRKDKKKTERKEKKEKQLIRNKNEI